MKILVAVKRVVDYAVQNPRQGGWVPASSCQRQNVDEPVRRDCRRRGGPVEGKGHGHGSRGCVDRIGKSTGNPAHGLSRSVRSAPFWSRPPKVRSWSRWAVAKMLKGVITAEQPQMVIMGKQAIDDDCNQTGQMLAAPSRVAAGHLRVEDRAGAGQREASPREVDGGLETVKLKLPAIVTTDLRLMSRAIRRCPTS